MIDLLYNEEHQVRSGWYILLAFIIMTVGQSIFMFPGMIYILSSAETIDYTLLFEGDIYGLIGDSPMNFFLIQGIATIGGFITTLLVWKYINKGTLKEIGFRGPIRDLGFGLLLGALSITAIFVILVITGDATLETALTKPNITAATFIYLVVFIFVGLFEEAFFRGYVMETMISRGNKTWLIYVGSAVFFSIVHGANPGVTVFGLINIVLVGFLFAYMYLETKSLWLPIGYHITWNYFQGSIYGFKVSGIDAPSVYTTNVKGGNTLMTGGDFGLEGGILASILIVLGFLLTKMYLDFFKTRKQNDLNY